jgi:hypothetical protein
LILNMCTVEIQRNGSIAIGHKQQTTADIIHISTIDKTTSSHYCHTFLLPRNITTMTGTVSNNRKDPPGNHARYEYEYVDVDVEANKALLPKNQDNYLEEQIVISELKYESEEELEFTLSLSYSELFCGVFLVLLGLLHITMSLPSVLNGLKAIVEDVGTNFNTNFNNSNSNNDKLLEDLKGFVTVAIDEAIRNAGSNIAPGYGCDIDIDVDVDDMPVLDDNSDPMQLMMLFGHSF